MRRLNLRAWQSARAEPATGVALGKPGLVEKFPRLPSRRGRAEQGGQLSNGGTPFSQEPGGGAAARSRRLWGPEHTRQWEMGRSLLLIIRPPHTH